MNKRRSALANRPRKDHLDGKIYNARYENNSMTRPPRIGSSSRNAIVSLPSWAVAIGAVVAGALGLAVFLASASLILMLAPVIVGAAFYIRWRVRRAFRKMAEQQRDFSARNNPDIIDGDYRIIDEAQDRFRR